MKRELAGAVVVLSCLHGCAASVAGSARAGWSPSANRSVSVVATSGAAGPTVAASSAPLSLEVWATVHGSAVGPLFPGMLLHSGDRIGLQARTSIEASVYLVHCASDGTLSVYPSSGPVLFEADQRVSLPAADKDLPLRGRPGKEVLYVLASKTALRRADPALHAALSGTDPDWEWNCGDEFEALLAGPPPGLPARAKYRFALRGYDSSDARYTVARAFADERGVIVLRFPFQHVP
jgi:hypothetical protein